MTTIQTEKRCHKHKATDYSYKHSSTLQTPAFSKDKASKQNIWQTVYQEFSRETFALQTLRQHQNMCHKRNIRELFETESCQRRAEVASL